MGDDVRERARRDRLYTCQISINGRFIGKPYWDRRMVLTDLQYERLLRLIAEFDAEDVGPKGKAK